MKTNLDKFLRKASCLLKYCGITIFSFHDTEPSYQKKCRNLSQISTAHIQISTVKFLQKFFWNVKYHDIIFFNPKWKNWSTKSGHFEVAGSRSGRFAKCAGTYKYNVTERFVMSLIDFSNFGMLSQSYSASKIPRSGLGTSDFSEQLGVNRRP